MLDASYRILRRHGDMPSPTMLYVLKYIIDSTERDEIMLVVCGPGLTVEYGGLR